MFDNLKQKTSESFDKPIDDTRDAARAIYDDAKVAAKNAIKSAGLEEEIHPVKPIKIGDPKTISDLNFGPTGPDQN